MDSHSYSQFLEYAQKINASLLVVGYKENTQKHSELHSGMLNLLQNSNLPVLIVKEFPKRKLKQDGSFYWLVCIKNSYGKSFKTFKKCLSFINNSKDIVRGVSIKSKNGNYDKDLEQKFNNYCIEKGVKRHSFKYLDNDKDELVTIGRQLSNIINFGEDYFDFVTLGCSPNSHFYLENNPLVGVLRLAQANILFSNGKTFI